MQISSFINHQVPKSEKKHLKLSPFNQQLLHEVNECSLIDIIQAIRGAHTAYEEWKKSNLADRKTLLEKLLKSLEINQDTFAKLEALDQGLPFLFVNQYSLKTLIEYGRKLCDRLELNEHHTPTGVITIVGSWNLSLRNILQRVFQALASGNAVLVKVSSSSPVTAEILKTLILETNVPNGLIQVIVSSDPEVKKLLVTHPGIHGISFTGALSNSVEVIKSISSVAENSFKKVQVLSGSKNIAVCLEAPDEENISSILESFLIGQGQLAWNSARLFVLEKFEKEWVQAMTNFLNTLSPSEGIEDHSLWGPCLKMNSFNIFSGLLNQAKQDQAKLIQSNYHLTDSQKKSFLIPTFTQDMSKCSELQQQQIFSPLFILSSVKYPFDIAKNANLSYYGFSAHLYGDVQKLNKIANDLEVGSVTFNNWSISQAEQIQGVKQSGFGIQDSNYFGAFYSNVKKMT